MPPWTRLCPPCNVCSNFPGAVGGDGGDDENDKEKEEEAERERQEAIREAEERRKEKHRKMEEEREKMRQEIRDKVSTLLLYAKASSTVSRYYLTPPIYVAVLFKQSVEVKWLATFSPLVPPIVVVGGI